MHGHDGKTHPKRPVPNVIFKLGLDRGRWGSVYPPRLVDAGRLVAQW